MKIALKILQGDSITKTTFKNRYNPGNLQPPFPLRAIKLLESTGQNITIPKFKMKNIPPWKINKTNVCTGLYYLNKRNYLPLEIKRHAAEHLRRKNNYIKIFTDGSKQNQGVGFAVHSTEGNISHSLPDEASIFSAEILAIMYSTLIIKSSENKQFVICSDSRSCIEAIDNYTHPNPLVMKTKILISELMSKGKVIQIC